MKLLTKVALSGIFILILVIGVSCSLVPQGIQNLFATKTPTPTNTATSTPTPTVTPTPTKTPLPPLSLRGCVFLEFCPQAVSVYDIADVPVNRDYLNTIKVPVNQPVQLLQDWTTLDQALLDKSLPNIEWVFTVDG